MFFDCENIIHYIPLSQYVLNMVKLYFMQMQNC